VAKRSTTSPGSVLKPAPRHKLAETVAQQLLAQVRSGGYKPGARMPSERELMASLGVGRSTIREALNGLALLGVIEVRHGQGAFVLHPDQATPPGALTSSLAKGVTRDLLEARVAIEVTIAELAARRRTAADMREIEAVLEQHTTLLERDEPAAEVAARFHLELAEAAHNEVLAGFIESVMGLLTERGPALEQRRGYREWELREHEGLLAAVRAGDPELAAQRMRDHLGAMTRHHSDIGLA
jgi:GntR family transcriptional regulator, transcriptional repressor for pyruvate dehydrogenase complex